MLFGTATILLLALPPLALAVSPQVVPVGIAFVLSSLASAQFGLAWEVSLQQNIPADRLARVYSCDILGSIIAVPVGQVVVGPLAGVSGLRATL